MPPSDELASDPMAPVTEDFPDVAAEKAAGIFVNSDEEIEEMRDVLHNWDFEMDDGNWGIDMYCQAVLAVGTHLGLGEVESEYDGY